MSNIASHPLVKPGSPEHETYEKWHRHLADELTAGYGYCQSRTKRLLKKQYLRERLKFCRRTNFVKSFGMKVFPFIWTIKDLIFKTNLLDQARAPKA